MRSYHLPAPGPLLLFATLIGGLLLSKASSQETGDQEKMPQPVASGDFDRILTASPFLRSLNLSEAYILTGTVRIENENYVVLMDRESGKTDLITARANEKGWKLVGLEGNPRDLRAITAKVSTSGGEVFAIKYDEQQFEPETGGLGRGGPRGYLQEKKAPVPERDYREGISGDGHRGPAPPELVRKLSQLDENTRNRLIHEIRVIRDKGVGSEERKVLFVKMVDKTLAQKR